MTEYPFNNGRFQRIFPLLVLLILLFPSLSVSQEPGGKFPVCVVYFIPADAEPFPDVEERLGRVLEHIRQFYRSEMQRYGFGPLTFDLERTEKGVLKVHYVRGKGKLDEYPAGSQKEIRAEVRTSLRAERIDIDQRVTLIFLLPLRWEGAEAVRADNNVGNGSRFSGTAWVYDDPRLDAAKLDSKEPGAYYRGECSVGQFNSRLMGAIAHELGHTFGLSHDSEFALEQKVWGIRSLMGTGSLFYGAELRGERERAILILPDAILLTRTRAIVGEQPFDEDRGSWEFQSLHAEYRPLPPDEQAEGYLNFCLYLEGRVQAVPPLDALIIRIDNQSLKDSYDARSVVAQRKEDGSFTAEIRDLTANTYQIYFTGVHANNSVSQVTTVWRVTADGNAKYLSPINNWPKEAFLKRLYRQWNVGRIAEMITELESEEESDSVLIRRARHLYTLMTTPVQRQTPASLPLSVRRLDLSNARATEEEVGYGRPLRKVVPDYVFLSMGGTFFESGLFAPAPSRYVFSLQKKWTTLDIGYGLQDDWHGSVIFIIKGDEKELWRSDRIVDHETRRVTLDLTGIDRLELAVEPGEDGPRQDWSIWVQPILTR